MSEFKGTPGPWFVTGNMTKYIESSIKNGLIQEIAAVGPTDADGGYGNQQQANAKLIAAAPELLESLQEVMAALTKLGFDGPAERKAQAAINKAIG
ncbi:hypothetical protein [Serratia fonticola]